MITTSPSVASGRAAQSSVERIVVVAQGKVLTDEHSVGLFEISVPPGSTSGGVVTLTIQVSSGTDRQVLTQEVLWACANGSGEAACTLSPPRDAELLTAGTLTNDWTWNWDPDTNKVTIAIAADTSLVPSGVNGFVAYFQIQNNGEQAVTIL